MNDNKSADHAHGGANDGSAPPVQRPPYWKRAHHDWRFWVAATLIFVCMAFYVLTVEFSLVPGRQGVPTLAMPAGG